MYASRIVETATVETLFDFARPSVHRSALPIRAATRRSRDATRNHSRHGAESGVVSRGVQIFIRAVCGTKQLAEMTIDARTVEIETASNDRLKVLKALSRRRANGSRNLAVSLGRLPSGCRLRRGTENRGEPGSSARDAGGGPWSTAKAVRYDRCRNRSADFTSRHRSQKTCGLISRFALAYFRAPSATSKRSTASAFP